MWAPSVSSHCSSREGHNPPQPSISRSTAEIDWAVRTVRTAHRSQPFISRSTVHIHWADRTLNSACALCSVIVSRPSRDRRSTATPCFPRARSKRAARDSTWTVGSKINGPRLVLLAGAGARFSRGLAPSDPGSAAHKRPRRIGFLDFPKD